MKSVANNSRTLIPEGKYEVIVHACSQKESQKGTLYIEFDFFIRGDVEQPAQGRHIYKKFYCDDGAWPSEKIGKYANALGVPEGEDFEPYELVGRNCIVCVKHYTSDGGEEKDCVFYTAPSKVEVPDPNAADFSDVKTEDIPF